jgi:hypothetical protein
MNTTTQAADQEKNASVEKCFDRPDKDRGQDGQDDSLV